MAEKRPADAPRLLLLSSSRTTVTAFLEHAADSIRKFLGTTVKEVTLVPFAAVNWTCDDMAERATAAFGALGYGISSLHAAADADRAAREAEAFAVAGGNTFQLLREMQVRGLLQTVRARVLAGAPYVGWSAGSNLACPTIRTTNDMPIVWPVSAEALGLVPFQINPHFTDTHAPDHQGETREERLQEFMRLNPRVTVVGLREGSALRIEGGRIELIGSAKLRLFRGGEIWEAAPGDSLEFLLEGGPFPISI